VNNFDKGYKYAQEENAWLANNWPEPNDGGLADDSEFMRGYDKFIEETLNGV